MAWAALPSLVLVVSICAGHAAEAIVAAGVPVIEPGAMHGVLAPGLLPPSRSPAAVGRGLVLQSRLHRALGDDQQALAFAQAALEADGASGQAWSALAYAQLLLGMTSREAAIDSFIQAITLQWRREEHPQAITADVLTLGNLLLDGPVSDPDSAFDLSTFALELTPNVTSRQHEDALLLRARALELLGDDASAAATLGYLVSGERPTAPMAVSLPEIFGGCEALPTVPSDPVDDTQPIFLVDGFTFNGEISAEVHLNATARFFDAIVIVEAWETHQAGMPRKSQLYMHTPYWQRVFARFGPKVHLVEVRDFPPVIPVSFMLYWRTKMLYHGVDYSDLLRYRAWWREDFHREQIVRGIPPHIARGRYILFVEDADEVVSPGLLALVSAHRVAKYNDIHEGIDGGPVSQGYMYNQMTCLVYGLHHAAMTPWSIAYMTSDRVVNGIAATHGHLASLTRIRSQFSGNHTARHIFTNRQHPNAGWHLTYMMPPHEIQRKLRSFTHAEYNTPEITSLANIQRCMREGEYLLPVHDSAMYPIQPPRELAAVVGEALDRFMRGELSFLE